MNEEQMERGACTPHLFEGLAIPSQPPNLANTIIWIVGMGNKPQLTVMHIPFLAEGTPEEVGSMFDSAVKECAEAVTRAHDQIERNRGEIERLGEETRDLISKMLAA